MFLSNFAEAYLGFSMPIVKENTLCESSVSYAQIFEASTANNLQYYRTFTIREIIAF